MVNPDRVARLIDDTVRILELDLSGVTVLTEAATGPYSVTPVIAFKAGAKRVLALTADSRYGSAETAISQTRALESFCDVSRATEIHVQRDVGLFADADLVTNLGFVRPIDAAAVARVRPGSVVSLMSEAWEIRAGDIDLSACRHRGVQVLATNEDFQPLDVFAYSGWLCVKLLLEAGLEVHRSRVLIVSSDKFGRVIERRLAMNGVSVVLAQRLDARSLNAADAVVIADYTRDDEIIGEEGDLTAGELARVAPEVTVIQFAGRIDVAGLRSLRVRVFPGEDIPARRMARTLAHLGARPVVELHAAGLKVGEMALRGTLATSRFAALAQHLLNNTE